MAFCATINISDRARRLPAVTPRAAAGAADHGDRHVVHPPEHRPRLEGRTADLGAVDPPDDGDVFTIGGVAYTWNKLIVVLITVPVLLVLIWLVQQTRQGKAMRATAQDQRTRRR